MTLRRRISITAVAAGLTALLAPASPAISAENAPGRYIVVLRNAEANPGEVAAEHGKRYGAQVAHVYRSALKGYAATIPATRLAAIRKDSRVLFISEDREVSISAQNVPTGIDRMQADASSQLSGNGSGSVSGVGVAVIDTGSGPHADLNVVGGTNCSNGKSYNDGNGHGTHVAGTIGAKDDSVGVVGVAPGVPIYSVRVLNNQGSGSWSVVACGVDWVTANASRLNIKVANMSLGGGGTDTPNCGLGTDALHWAICGSINAGVTYVVAAGNENADISTSVPAAYNETLAVTALADYNGAPGGGARSTCRAGVDETPADFSNYTTPNSDDAGHTIAAPGVCINSTWKGGGYSSISGTSMASPHVAGAAALCIAHGDCSSTSPASVISRLRGDAAARPSTYGFVGDPSNPVSVSGKTRYYGHLAYAGGY